MNRITAVPAQEIDDLGRDPRVGEEPYYLPAGMGWTWSSAIAAAYACRQLVGLAMQSIQWAMTVPGNWRITFRFVGENATDVTR